MSEKLSIITINRNNAAGLRKTMESVFSQTYRDFEYIVVDGASTDGSVDIIREYESVHSLNVQSFNFIWISEPDTGIYNAMNKGVEIALGKRVVDTFNRSTLCGDKNKEIEIAEGKRVVNSFNRSTLCGDKNKGVKNKGNEDGYVVMLNSGDYLVDEHVIARIVPELDGTDIIQGNVIIENKGKKVIACGYGRSDISFIDAMQGSFVHQASFCCISLFDKYGYFDESYKINGDTVFYAKCLGFGDATFKYVNLNIAYYDMTGISADPKGQWTAIRKEEDDRYACMFSRRMWDLCNKEQKKIRLYDQLHSHKWSWYLTMVLVRICNFLYKKDE